MEVYMADVGVDDVGVHGVVGVRERDGVVRVLVGMRVDVPATVAVAIGVHRIRVVVVSGPIGMGNIRVVLIPRICVIAMASVQMIWIGYIAMVLVRRGFALVIVIAVLHIPEVLVRRLLRRGIQMTGARHVGMIGVWDCVCVVRMERIVEVIGVPAVGVIVEREIAVRVVVIAMVAVAVAVSVLVRRAVRVVGVRRRVRMRRVAMRSCVSVVSVRHVSVIGVVVVRRDDRIQMDIQVLNNVVPVT